MNRLLFFFLLMTFFVTAKGQSNYAEAMKQGDDAFKKAQYKTAINKYFAAEAFDPTKKDIVKEKVNKVFDAIEALRKKAEDDKTRAEKAEKEANKQKEKAEAALAEANEQKRLTEEATSKALKSDNAATVANTINYNNTGLSFYQSDKLDSAVV